MCMFCLFLFSQIAHADSNADMLEMFSGHGNVKNMSASEMTETVGGRGTISLGSQFSSANSIANAGLLAVALSNSINNQVVTSINIASPNINLNVGTPRR